MKLHNILKTIKTICYNQPNVNTVFVGDIYDLNTQKDIEYSVMVITEQTHTVNSNDGYEVWGINLFYVDRQTSDNSNILDIHSHAVEVLNSVVNELEEIGVIIENTYQINTFNERFAALCSGAYVTLNLRVPLATCDKYELVHSVNGMRGDVIINTSNPISQIEEGNTKDSVNSVAVINYVAPIKDRVSSAETNITTLQSTKQDNLISGTNIKTVNGNSLLGSGNITIDGGSNFIGKLGSYTTYLSGFLNALSVKGAVSNFQGISKDAAQVGDIFVIEAKAADTHDYYIFVLECETPKTNDVRGHTIYSYIIRDYELWSNKVTQITSASTDIQYPSAKAVYDELQKKQDTLVSGTNIKTINGNSILGSGNLEIEGGGGSEPAQYIKDATVSGNTLTLTKKDDSKVEFTPQGGGTISEDLFYMLAGNDQYIIWEDVDGNIHRTFQKLGPYTNTTGIRLNDKVKKILVGGLEKNQTSLYCVLNGCPNLEEFWPIINTENITSFEAAFVGSSDKLYINGLEKWNTSKVTNVRGLLPIVSKQVNVLNTLDFRKVTNFGTVGGGVLYGSQGVHFLDIEIDFSEILMPSVKIIRVAEYAHKIKKLKMFGVPCIYENGKFNSGAILNYSACVNAEVIEFPQKCPLLFDGVNITMVDGAFYSPLDLYYEQDHYFNMAGKEDDFINALGTFVVDESVGFSEYNYLCVENPNDGSKLPLVFQPTIKLNSTRQAALTDAQKEIIANKGWTII